MIDDCTISVVCPTLQISHCRNKNWLSGYYALIAIRSIRDCAQRIQLLCLCHSQGFAPSIFAAMNIDIGSHMLCFWVKKFFHQKEEIPRNWLIDAIRVIMSQNIQNCKTHMKTTTRQTYPGEICMRQCRREKFRREIFLTNPSEKG